jgi:hypothetical protein
MLPAVGRYFSPTLLAAALAALASAAAASRALAPVDFTDEAGRRS